MNMYDSLNTLLKTCDSARIYFLSLPHSVQKAILSSNKKITSEDELYLYAESIMHEFV